VAVQLGERRDGSLPRSQATPHHGPKAHAADRNARSPLTRSRPATDPGSITSLLSPLLPSSDSVAAGGVPRTSRNVSASGNCVHPRPKR